MPLSRNNIPRIGLTRIRAFGPGRKRSGPNRPITQALGRGGAGRRAGEPDQTLELGRREELGRKAVGPRKGAAGPRKGTAGLSLGRDGADRASGVESSRLDWTGLDLA
ncbi:hypothetical protein CDL15_Pgr017728 [Punica granatum]|uniref:Uncharacterized protein n=1 Tax=Punica granatum TaxID=22663 RepID=A0A218WG93_PUNGR|nr:hypothetical protein CDL15_Pgr017728 [Punica granatum]